VWLSTARGPFRTASDEVARLRGSRTRATKFDYHRLLLRPGGWRARHQLRASIERNRHGHTRPFDCAGSLSRIQRRWLVLALHSFVPLLRVGMLTSSIRAGHGASPSAHDQCPFRDDSGGIAASKDAGSRGPQGPAFSIPPFGRARIARLHRMAPGRSSAAGSLS